MGNSCVKQLWFWVIVSHMVQMRTILLFKGILRQFNFIVSWAVICHFCLLMCSNVFVYLSYCYVAWNVVKKLLPPPQFEAGHNACVNKPFRWVRRSLLPSKFQKSWKARTPTHEQERWAKKITYSNQISCNKQSSVQAPKPTNWGSP